MRFEGLHGRETLLAVGPEYRWLTALFATLLKAGVPVEALQLADQRLRLSTASTQGAPARLVVSPMKAELKGYRQTRRFVLGFEGRGTPASSTLRLLDFFHGILLRHEANIPFDLRGFAAAVRRTDAPEKDLLRLFPFVTLEHSQAFAGDPGTSGEPESIVEVMVRTTSRCNQVCPFCSAPEHDTPSHESICDCLQSIGQLLPGAMISLTGGEPTVRETFMPEVLLALGSGQARQVQIQTNGVRFAESLDPAELPRDERLSFFVSLHALEESIYDICTGTTGQLPLAISGIKRLLSSGHRVTINTVVTSLNVNKLSEMVEALPAQLGDNRPLSLHFSVLICPEWRVRASSFLVPYSELVPRLEEAAVLGQKLGLQVQSLLSSTHASVPACLVSQRSRDIGRHTPEISDHETGYEDLSRPWVKARRCAACAEDGNCLGVPREYAKRFGLDELSPMEDA